MRAEIRLVFLRTFLPVAQLVPLLVFVTLYLTSARLLTHPVDSSASAISRLQKMCTSHQSADSQINEKLYMVAELC